ncbi:MAG: hypothetical protein Q4D41_04825 [Prevotellaceae bacterium]|nr:hypothetical protein [Prevotellaceae bacterium]
MTNILRKPTEKTFEANVMNTPPLTTTEKEELRERIELAIEQTNNEGT